MSTGSVARSIRRAFLECSPAAFPVAGPSSPFLSSRAQRVSSKGCNCSQKRFSSHPTAAPPPASAAKTGLPPRKKRTILDLALLKRQRIPITMLTAHDFPSARLIESASSLGHISPDEAAALSAEERKAVHLRRGIDICLVGDSLAMVACGYTNTNSLSLDEMLYHCRSVARGCHSSLLLADLPFGTYGASVEQGVKSAFRLIQEGNMDAVKIEGGQENVPLVKRLSELGVPVMAHIGLTPQRAAALSGFRVQGKTVASAKHILEDALALQAAGAFSLLIEAVPTRLGQYISERVTIPTIGIGAGPQADGQVLVQLDMMGVNSLEKGPKFLKKFANMEEVAAKAIRGYVEEVRARSFPAEEHTYAIDDETWAVFEQAMEQDK